MPQVSALVTIGDALGAGSALQVFLSNFGPEAGASPAPWAPVARNVSLTMRRAAADGAWPAAAVLRRIDDNATAPYAAWAGQGKPRSPTPGQIAAMHAASEVRASLVPLAVQGEVATIELELPPLGVAHLSFD